MTSQLQNILDLIRQSEQLNDSEKAALEKAVKEAEKAFEITNFKLDRTEKVKRTTAILLEETIAELEQKRKAVEEQNRELEIETAVERVRAEAMAMHSTNDFEKVSQQLLKQVKNLNLQGFTGASICLIDENQFMSWWDFSSPGNVGDPKSQIFRYDAKKYKVLGLDVLDKWQQGESYMLLDFDLEKLHAATKEWEEINIDVAHTFKKVISEGKLTHQWNPSGRLSKGFLTFDMLQPPTDDVRKITIKMAHAFNQAYTRFLDLQKAEAQAREAQIETALERVRSRSLAMHKSEELREVIAVVFEKLKELNFNMEHRAAIINIYSEGSKEFTEWITDPGQTYPTSFVIPDLPFDNLTHVWEARAKAIDFTSRIIYKKEKNPFFDYLFEHTGYKYLPEEIKKGMLETEYYIYSIALGKNSGISLPDLSGRQMTESEIDILKRFAKVFDQAYTRFLDLQKAEAQAREAQIEVALERVRARTMAMQKSEELAEVAVLLYRELKGLGVSQDFFECGYVEVDEINNIQRGWSTRPDGSFLKEPFYLPLTGEPVSDARYVVWKQHVPFFHQPVGGDELQRHIEFVLPFMNSQEAVEITTSPSLPDPIHFYFGYFDHGYLNINCGTPLSVEAELLLVRFTRVFEMTYTRFLDLKKSEAQAKEAQIQLALERVRARTMAMQSSHELAEVSYLLNKQIVELGIPTRGCAFNIYNEHDSTEWFSNLEGTLPTYKTPRENVFLRYFEAGQRGEILLIEEYSGQKIKDHYKYLSSLTILAEGDKTADQVNQVIPELQIDHVAYFKYGYLLFITLVPAPEAHDVFRRFAREFEQTYTRFLDLQKAEAQAREAQIEVAVERVRAKALAMHKSAEIMGVAVTMRIELETLNMPGFDAATITLIQDDGTIRLWDNTSAKQHEDGTWENTEFIFRLEDNNPNFYLNKIWSSSDRYIVVEQDEHDLKITTDWVRIHDKNLADVVVHYYKENGIKQAWHPAVALTYGRLNLDFYVHGPEPEVENILIKMAAAFDLAYKRFLDLQKAEAQAREAQIEAALERVRSRSMGMQKSDELRNVVQVIYEQFVHLGIDIFGADFRMDYREKEDWLIWSADRINSFPSQLRIPYFDHPYWNAWNDAKRKGMDVLAYTMGLEEKNSFVLGLSKHIPDLSAEGLDIVLNTPGYSVSNVFLQHVALSVDRFKQEPFSEADNAILIRFAKVFEQTYTRFLDLQKAEAQAREAQIEAALERVRSRTMAMHKSDELAEVTFDLFEQMHHLGFARWGASIALADENRGGFDVWFTTPEKRIFSESHFLPNQGHPVAEKMWNVYKQQTELSTTELKDEAKRDYDQWMFANTPLGNMPENVKTEILSERYVMFSLSAMKYGFLESISIEPISSQLNEILPRFAKVFEQTYTRFLDLKKAEAQAREAQIEAALERVRSRTMGMQNSNELREVIQVIFEQFQNLSIDLYGAAFAMDYMESEDWFIWSADIANLSPALLHIPYFDHPYWNSWNDARRKGLDSLTYTMELEEKNNFVSEFAKYIPDLPAEVFQAVLNTPGYTVSNVFLKNVTLYIDRFNTEPFSDADNAILMRFGKVFEQTYTRFKDLEKAEAQAREAQIEAALERVRARTMAMQRSEELPEVAALLFQQVKTLGVPQFHCGFNIFEIDDKECIWYPGSPDGDILPPCKIPLTEHPVFMNFIESRKRGDELCVYEKEGEYQAGHYRYMLSLPVLGEILQNMLDAGIPFPTFQIDHLANFSHGNLLFITSEHFPEMHDTFKRFAKIFEQTYTRFLDLQKAEAQAQEAIKRASVDRVRAEIASMRTLQDLDRITPLIWKELTSLNIPFVRCGVFIMDDDKQAIHTFLSTPDGRAIAAFELAYNAAGNLSNAIENWREHKKYMAHWLEKEFSEQADTLVNQGALSSREQYLNTIPKEGIYLHFLPFLQGMLYVGNTAALNEEQLDLIQAVADAFSTAYARYEDFNKLEAAKQQVDKTLMDLRQTQQQLVQSEKMASLGELTAGIAHEIQNPLNFVNNFSEVNKELLGEMNEEIQKGNYDEVKAIAKDVVNNEAKIIFHGKRADAIVKGMLQHSRSSSGVKEPTDINALADEYLRLAYHGLKAKEKSLPAGQAGFNATMKTDFDETIGNINIIPQDIGRVVLNLINNAFYAVNARLNESFGQEKSKQGIASYEPTVSVSTRKEGNKVLVSVKDNGSGIPDSIKEKIFQPFFTTKPTGQGTGLGLSLSYDIVKAHGGEISVESEEGKGTQFTIQIPLS